ncbi:MAG: flagellar FlbD family protein [Clostridiaceae bacterium]|jgi:flagellar protein FlbD|nr:flagellar FlbD family protein [Clostridiaceae bacterium]
MIELTRLNGLKFVLNCEFIESLEETPDTVISTTNGKKFLVSENIEEIVGKVIEYKRKVFYNILSKD